MPRPRRPLPSDPLAREAETLKALAHPIRLRIVAAVASYANGGATSDRIRTQFPDVAPDMFWWHVGQLARVGLMESVPVGGSVDRRLRAYRLDLDRFARIAGRLETPAVAYASAGA